MPFKIALTYSAQREMMNTAFITAVLVGIIYSLAQIHPAILRIILLGMLSAVWLSLRLPTCKVQRLYWMLLAGLLVLVFFLFDQPMQQFISRSIEGMVPPGGTRSNAEMINDHMNLVQKRLLDNLQYLAGLLWPKPLEGGGSLVLGLVLASQWGRVRRRILRWAPNIYFQRVAWVCDYLPKNIARYIWVITLNGLIYLFFWGIGLSLLGFSNPVAPALLMAFASATPFWGPLFAVLLSFFFIGDVRHLPFQIIGVAITFAVTWLASYLLLLQYVPHDRPVLPKGVLLLLMLCGMGLFGFFGFLFAVPIISFALLRKDNLTEAR